MGEARQANGQVTSPAAAAAPLVAKNAFTDQQQQQQQSSDINKQQQSDQQQQQQSKLNQANSSSTSSSASKMIQNSEQHQHQQRDAAQKLAHFYKGKNILVTGATGFIGKVFLLKLVSSLGDCGKIYVMLRPKKGLTPQQRFNKMLAEAPFNPQLMLADPADPLKQQESMEQYEQRLARIRQADWSKVVPVEGDMSCEDLGLEDDIKQLLCQTVDIVFNVAASVQFDAPLKQNLRDNYLGVHNIMNLATQFEKLISFVHVSTFYTNSHISHVEEKVLPMQRDCEKMAELIQWMPESMLDSMGTSLLENRPNTYIFTKAMAENLVLKYQGRLPVAIVRPSIVVPSRRDPEPGWVDNVNGPMGLGTLASIGILRNIDWNYWGACDFIPVDYVVNTMLTVAERTPRLQTDEIKVYNCSSSSLNPTTWGGCFETLRAESIGAPPYKMLRIPIEVPKHKRANRLGFALTKLSEILFAYLIDFILVLCGQKRLLTRLTSKLHHGYELLRPFTTTEYTCSNDNLMAAYEELQEEDKREFDFNIKELDWEDGFKRAYYGARRRLLKEDLSNVPAAIVKMRILRVVELVFKVMCLGLIGWASYKLYSNFNHQAIVSF